MYTLFSTTGEQDHPPEQPTEPALAQAFVASDKTPFKHVRPREPSGTGHPHTLALIVLLDPTPPHKLPQNPGIGS